MFSVLLSIYKKEKLIYFKQSLDSVLSQNLLPDEIVLVKDGALTKELDYIIECYKSKYSIMKVVSLPENIGLGKALNEGLKYCSYDIVARMDTDDIAKPDRFYKQIEIFQKYQDLDVVGAWIDEFQGDISNVKSTRKLPENHEDILHYGKSRCPVNHPVVMFKKQSVLDAGGYQHFPLFEDYYLWVRMMMNGAKFYNIQESLLNFRFSSDMFKRRGGWKYALTELRFQKKMFNIGFISRFQFIKNISTRFIARILPNTMRAALYKKLLRR